VAEKLTLDDPEHASAPVRRLPIKMRDIVLFNPNLRDSDFFLPGTLGIVLLMVCLTLSTVGFVREKEQETIEQLCATPIPRASIVAGKIIPHGLIAVADFVLVTSVARAVFALPLRGSIPSIVLLAVLFILAVLALGSFISTLSKTQLEATFMNVFVTTLSLLLSGFIFPRQAMPGWLQPIASALPMTYFIDGIRALTLKGTAAAEVLHDFMALGAFVLLFGSLSVAGFRKTMA
jgi:drug efflux transport system permease protein